jgi:hypothetical protein
MEFSEVILALVGGLSTISAWVVKNLVTDIRRLNDKMTQCQTSMPKEYVLKADHNREMQDIKKMLGNIYDIIREKEKK